MTKIQAGRLLTLAWFLRTQVPKKDFDMVTYATVDGVTIGADPVGRMRADCGTTACALGWATAVFPDRFKLATTEAGTAFNVPFDIKHRRKAHYDDPLFVEFFGLDIHELHHAFYCIKRTPEQEATVLEKLAEKHGWVYADIAALRVARRATNKRKKK